jgi:polyisoprenyl-teichoic acid--peptidoglycan teichoic acid transferase
MLVGRLVVALCITSALMVGAVLTVNYVIDAKLSSAARVGVHTASSHGGAMNFLVVGSDTRAFTSGSRALQQQFGNEAANGGQRSDTMMVVRVDPSHSKTLVVSFPRDLWVRVPGLGMSKINSAYNAGPQRVVDMLLQDFGIKINHFIQVDFKSFQGVVNAVGTIPVYVPYPARDNLTGLYQPVAGCEQFGGADALAYVRSRELQYYSPQQQRWVPADAVPDIDRIARQQQFIRRLAGIAVKRSLSNPLTANEIVNRVLENVTIDQGLSKSDILSFVDAFRSINPNDTGHVQFGTMPWMEGPNQAGQQVLYVREPDAAGLLARLGGAVDPANVAVNGTTPGSSSPTTGPAAGTSPTTSAPSGSTPAGGAGAPGAAPAARINNEALLGSVAPRLPPC